MSEQFQPGDVVWLKSGSPKMTIESMGVFGTLNKAQRAKCIWFDGAKKMEDLFELHALVKDK